MFTSAFPVRTLFSEFSEPAPFSRNALLGDIASSRDVKLTWKLSVRSRVFVKSFDWLVAIALFGSFSGSFGEIRRRKMTVACLPIRSPTKVFL